MLQITDTLAIPLDEIEIHPIRAQGAGGQNIHKTASAVHLRFDVPASSLPDTCKERLLRISDQRTTRDGVIVIKAQEHRSLDQNREAALERLCVLVKQAATVPRVRKATRPTRSSKLKRLDSKARRGSVKRLRGRIDD